MGSHITKSENIGKGKGNHDHRTPVMYADNHERISTAWYFIQNEKFQWYCESFFCTDFKLATRFRSEGSAQSFIDKRYPGMRCDVIKITEHIWKPK